MGHVISDLPAGLSERELYEFAFRLINEQQERIDDYLFAAVCGADNHDLLSRWLTMAELVAEIHGGEIVLTYRTHDDPKAGRREH